MGFTTIHYEIGDSIATITLSRPEKLNSFDLAMAKEVRSAFESAASNPEVRVIVLTGAGTAFSAGQDLSEAAAAITGWHKSALDSIVNERWNPIVKAIRGTPKPVICAVNGVAAGASASLAFACDIVVAAREATFMQAFVNVGLIPDSGGTWFAL